MSRKKCRRKRSWATLKCQHRICQEELSTRKTLLGTVCKSSSENWCQRVRRTRVLVTLLRSLVLCWTERKCYNQNHSHSRTHSHTLARTHTHGHTRARTHTLARTHTHTHTHTRTHPHTHTHTRAHTHTHSKTCFEKKLSIFTWMSQKNILAGGVKVLK
jgi:hypothetical protein